MKFPQLESPVRKLYVSWAQLPTELYFWAFCHLKTGLVPVGRNKFSPAGTVMVTSGCGVGETEASQASYFTETPLTVALEHRGTIPRSFSSSVHCLWYLSTRPNKSHLDFNLCHEKLEISHKVLDCITFARLGRQERKEVQLRCLCPFTQAQPSTFTNSEAERNPNPSSMMLSSKTVW